MRTRNTARCKRISGKRLIRLRLSKNQKNTLKEIEDAKDIVLESAGAEVMLWTASYAKADPICRRMKWRAVHNERMFMATLTNLHFHGRRSLRQLEC